jgi:hypothetical protein
VSLIGSAFPTVALLRHPCDAMRDESHTSTDDQCLCSWYAASKCIQMNSSKTEVLCMAWHCTELELVGHSRHVDVSVQSQVAPSPSKSRVLKAFPSTSAWTTRESDLAQTCCLYLRSLRLLHRQLGQDSKAIVLSPQ